MAKHDSMGKGNGAYQDKDASFLRRVDQSMTSGKQGKKDIYANVNKNSDEARGGFSGGIKYGTDD